MVSTVELKFTTHFRAVLDNIDIASETMPVQISRAVRFTKSMSKLLPDEAVVQAQHQAIHERELVPFWTGSLDAMPPIGLNERTSSFKKTSPCVNEWTTKILPCASPTDLNASNERSYSSSPLERAAWDSLQFLGISLTPYPLLAVCGIDYRDSSDPVPPCSILRSRGLSGWRRACH